MKLLSDKRKSQILIIAALSLPVSVLATWSFSGGKEWTYYPVSIGSANSNAQYSLAVGYANNTGSYSLTVGQYLSSPGYNSLVVGKWNDNPTGAYFVVGYGTSGDRKNALEVYNDGRVVIPTEAQLVVEEPNDDIPMYGE